MTNILWGFLWFYLISTVIGGFFHWMFRVRSLKTEFALAVRIGQARGNMDVSAATPPAVIEEYLQAFDDACAAYLRVEDQGFFAHILPWRFKESYLNEVKKTAENPDFTAFFRGTPSPYQNILSVYREWHQVEHQKGG